MSELFDELYGAYYHKVAQVLKAAVLHPKDADRLSDILTKAMPGIDSGVVTKSLKEGIWPLLGSDYSTSLKNVPTRPMTMLEKQWLKAVYLDPRIRLFIDESDDMLNKLSDVEPLFSSEDVMAFDRYSDGDPYTDETYIRNFKLALEAVRRNNKRKEDEDKNDPDEKYPVNIEFTGPDGGVHHKIIFPEYLEYSEKDDKFRLVGTGKGGTETFNMTKITDISPCDPARQHEQRWSEKNQLEEGQSKQKSVTLELVDEKNVLERVLLHFAHYKKETRKLDEKRYKVKIWYDKEDESEIVIRVMSFGPSVTVTDPKVFVEQIKKKLIQQMQMWE